MLLSHCALQPTATAAWSAHETNADLPSNPIAPSPLPAGEQNGKGLITNPGSHAQGKCVRICAAWMVLTAGFTMQAQRLRQGLPSRMRAEPLKPAAAACGTSCKFPIKPSPLLSSDPGSPDCRVQCAGAESKASGENEDEGWTRQGRGKKSQAVTRGQSSVQVCVYWPGAGLVCVGKHLARKAWKLSPGRVVAVLDGCWSSCAVTSTPAPVFRQSGSCTGACARLRSCSRHGRRQGSWQALVCLLGP